jgi:hypothetical protein
MRDSSEEERLAHPDELRRSVMPPPVVGRFSRLPQPLVPPPLPRPPPTDFGRRSMAAPAVAPALPQEHRAINDAFADAFQLPPRGSIPLESADLVAHTGDIGEPTVTISKKEYERLTRIEGRARILLHALQALKDTVVGV